VVDPPRYIDRFEVAAHLGGGAIGPVFRAHDPHLQRDVVLRVIDDELVGQARAMAQLSHPNIVQVFEVGNDGGTSFIVMEYVPGIDLARWLAAEPRTAAAIISAFVQAGNGLVTAHAHGIVHGSFKPENVLIGDDGRVRVVDIGLSRKPATVASDTRAFGAALQAAVGDAALPADVRTLLARSTSELAQLLAALAPRNKRSSRWIVPTIVVLGAGGAVAAAMLLLGTGAPPAACDEGPAWFSPIERGRLHYLEEMREAGAGVADTFAKRDAALRKNFVAVCEQTGAGKLTAAQADVQRSCLYRRAYELEGVLRGALARAPNASRRVTFTDDGAQCAEVESPAFADNGRAKPLWLRYARSDDLATPATAKEHERHLVELERDAADAGEQELVMRSTLALARELELQDRYAEATAAAERAYTLANQIKAPSYAAMALLQHSAIARRGHDAAAAQTFAQSADDLAKTFNATPLLRALIYQALARAAHARADWKALGEYTAKGIDVVTKSGLDASDVEIDLRMFYVIALQADAATHARAVTEGETLVARAKQLVGEHDNNYAVALNTLAAARNLNGDAAGALQLREQALKILATKLPATHSNVLLQRVDYGNALYEAGRFTDARDQLVEAMKHVDSNQSVRAQRSMLRAYLARATFANGNHNAALAIAREAAENALADHGTQHPHTMAAYQYLVDIVLELDLLDEAETAIAALQRMYKAKPEYARFAAAAGRCEAEIANRRGKPRVGERLARRALAGLAELGASIDLAAIHRVLAASLLAQGRSKDARAELQRALELAKQREVRADELALIDLGFAQVELAERKREAARKRAKAARVVLERYPAHVRGNRLAAEILGEQPKKHR
jgi:hypothetical protein